MDKLFRISIMVSLIGMLSLIFLSTTLEPHITKIKDIEISDLESAVKVVGEIKISKEFEKITIFDITDETGKIKGIMYEKINLQDSNVEIMGKIIEYGGELEIEIRKIKKI